MTSTQQNRLSSLWDKLRYGRLSVDERIEFDGLEVKRKSAKACAIFDSGRGLLAGQYQSEPVMGLVPVVGHGWQDSTKSYVENAGERRRTFPRLFTNQSKFNTVKTKE